MARSFSERTGLKPVRVETHTEGMSEALRNRLWNVLHDHYFWARDWPEYGDLQPLAYLVWDTLFKLPVDTLPETGWEFTHDMRNHYFSCEWNEVFDLIEAVLTISPRSGKREEFSTSCNKVLNEEGSWYQLINNQFVPIDSEEEKRTTEDAIEGSPDPVSQQIARALELLSDRRNPVYRNSIKESISAVETLCRQITGKPNATLGEAINIISRSSTVSLHPAFAEALKKLYGWTSDDGGIRHSLMDESNLSLEDARFMLVVCSAFVNYLLVKADKEGLHLRRDSDEIGDQAALRHRRLYDEFAPPPDNFAPSPDDFAPPPSDVGEIPF